MPAHIWTPWFSVLGSKAGLRRGRGVLWRSRAAHLRARDRALVRSCDELADLRARSLPAGLQLGRALAREARPRGHGVRRAARLLRDPARPGDRRGLRRHGGVLPGGGQVPPRRPPQVQCRALAGGDAARSPSRAPCAGSRSRWACCTGSRSSPTARRGCDPRARARSATSCRCPRCWPSSHGVGASSKAVQRSYDRVLSRLGPELFLLGDAPLDEIERAGTPLLAEAIARMREGRVIRDAGYDGEYGAIRVFQPEELAQRRGGGLLFQPEPAAPEPPPAGTRPAAGARASEAPRPGPRRGRADAEPRQGPASEVSLARRPGACAGRRGAARRARPGAAGRGGDHRGRGAPPRGAGHGQDPHAHAPDRAPRPGSRGAAGAVPRDHVHPPGCRRDAGAARRAARRVRRPRARHDLPRARPLAAPRERAGPGRRCAAQDRRRARADGAARRGARRPGAAGGPAARRHRRAEAALLRATPTRTGPRRARRPPAARRAARSTATSTARGRCTRTSSPRAGSSTSTT